MNYLKTAAVSGILTVSMAASMLAGCGKHVNGTAAALIVNGEEVNVGTANFILRYQQAETAQIMQMYGLTDGAVLWDTDISDDGTEEETEASASESASEAVSDSASSSASDAEAASSASSSSAAEEEKHYNTYGEQYKDSVLENIERMVVMRQHMADYGLSITDEQQAKIDEVAAEVCEANKDILGKLGTTEADVNQVIELISYEYFMHDAMLEGVEINVTDEEAAQKTFTYARFGTTIKDEETGEERDMTEEEIAGVEAKANELIRQVSAEDDVANVDIYSLATDLDPECTCMQTSFGSDDTIFPDEVKDALATLKDGELYDSVIKVDGYFYVVRLDKEFDEEQTESKRNSLISTREQEHIEDQLQKWVDESEIEVKDGWNSLEVTDSRPYVAKAEQTEDDAAATSAESTSEDDAAATSAESTSEDDAAATSAESTSADDAAASSSSASAE
ncbi:MAG: hypothetical protein IJG17_04820 [Eubacterium sp.]|nr:hypothetical protein [Eubacterium sp.]